MMIIRYNIDLFFCFLHIRVITISTFGDESSNFTDETNKLRQSKKEIPFISILLLSLFVVAAQCSNGMKVRRQDICFTFLPRGFHPMYVHSILLCSTTILIYVEVEGLLHPSITTKFTMPYLEKIEHNETDLFFEVWGKNSQIFLHLKFSTPI